MTRGKGVGKGMWRGEGRLEKKVGTDRRIYCLKERGLHLEGNAASREAVSM